MRLYTYVFCGEIYCLFHSLISEKRKGKEGKGGLQCNLLAAICLGERKKSKVLI